MSIVWCGSGIETMNLLLIADVYEPSTISAAQQLRDLVACLADAGDSVTVLIPAAVPGLPQIECNGRVTLIRADAPRTKDVGHLRRLFAEFVLPWYLWRAYRASGCAEQRLDGILWYSPTIFLGPLVAWLKYRNACRAYLILRDLFPDWAVDAGILRRGAAYRVLKWVESYQYHQADVIGVQTRANLAHLEPWRSPARRIEVLPNWLAPAPVGRCGIVLADSRLAGRNIMVYAGNMGVAQEMGAIFEALQALQDRADWGFVFVGRGSEAAKLKDGVAAGHLDNVLFFDEIPSEDIPALFAQCHAGIVALDPRHTTHNVPGKFIAYLRAGLPVLARVNPGNDLLELIPAAGVGVVVASPKCFDFEFAARKLMDCSASDRALMAQAANALWRAQYAATACAEQVRMVFEADFRPREPG